MFGIGLNFCVIFQKAVIFFVVRNMLSSFGLKFRLRIAILVLCVCTLIIILYWKRQLKFTATKRYTELFFDSTCDYHETCVYDQSSTLSMTSDDEIVVAEDHKTGAIWTLGHVRRDPTSEAWLLDNITSTHDKSTLSFPNLVIEPHEKQIEPSSSNRTNGRSLIFNRVPKCASSMLVDLLWKLMLHRNNHFKYFSWKTYWERQLTIQKQEEFLEYVIVKKNEKHQLKLPFAMDRHVYFVDAKQYKVEKGK